MARVFRRQDRDDPFYWIEFLDERKKKRRERIGPDKRQAKEILAQRQVEVRDRKFAPLKAAADVRLRDVIDLYLRDVVPTLTYRKGPAHALVRWSAYLGDVRLRDVTPQIVQAFVASEMRTSKPSTVNKKVATLRRLFNVAAEWGLSTSNPCDSIKPLRENNARLRFLTKEEASKLVECSRRPDRLGHDISTLIVVALNTGARLGELLRLTWADVDLGSSTVSFAQTKSGKRRSIPLNKDAAAALRALPGSSGRVFVRSGKPVSDVRGAFERACRLAGISDFRFHDLRHTFASHAAMAGMPMETLRRMLGHSTLVMVSRYAHLSDTHMAEAAELVSLGTDTQADTKPPKPSPPKGRRVSQADAESTT